MKRAQATIELTLSFIVIVLLLAGMVKLTVWAVTQTVKRHNAYVNKIGQDYNYNDAYRAVPYDPALSNAQFYKAGKADIVPDIVPLKRTPAN